MRTAREIWAATGEAVNLILNLRARWQDEREYEDIKDYLKPIQSLIPEATQMHKRPFGFTAKASDGTIKIWVEIKSSGVEIKGKIA